ncbi:hypothetical protein SAMD00023353_4800390 [Rosellinia necatrix]|uniref:Uncharacterized protein n=1 Tax=Rosellinia necatrix TaxID=77044 RepID=A0A1S8A9K5_ROSNE|nr:hypothetical protein SAMD00023353_4800390 [Rosellinia necatrix]
MFDEGLRRNGSMADSRTEMTFAVAAWRLARMPELEPPPLTRDEAMRNAQRTGSG